MSFCGQCGAKLPASAGFCGECGRRTDEPFADPNVRAAPADAMTSVMPATYASTSTFQPAPVAAPVTAPIAAPVAPIDYQPEPAAQPARSGRGGMMVVLALLGLAAVAGGIYLVTRSEEDRSTDGLATTIAGATTVVGDSSTTPTDASSTTTPIDPALIAAEQLQTLVAEDRPIADTLVGFWIPQLSAKRVGLEADGIVYGPVEIVADHTPLRDTYGAILVDGGAFQFTSGGSPMTGWFLTIVPETFASKAEALQWCTDHGLGANVCLAREFKPPTP